MREHRAGEVDGGEEGGEGHALDELLEHYEVRRIETCCVVASFVLLCVGERKKGRGRGSGEHAAAVRGAPVPPGGRSAPDGRGRYARLGSRPGSADGAAEKDGRTLSVANMPSIAATSDAANVPAASTNSWSFFCILLPARRERAGGGGGGRFGGERRGTRRAGEGRTAQTRRRGDSGAQTTA